MNKTLRELRESLEINQDDLSKRLGVSISTISAIERGKMEMSKDMKNRISKEFNIEISTESKKSSEAPAWFEEMKLMWKEEIEFLKTQIERKDRMLDALTEKLVKVEVSNWPPMFPINGALGLETEAQLRVA